MERYDAIVLGVGGVGSAALYQLAKRGVRAIGIDRFNPPHDRGSSHGHTRVIRQAYFEHSDYVPLLKDAYRLWQELESLANRQLFHQIGLIEVGPPGGEVVPGVLCSGKTSASSRIAHCRTNRAEVARTANWSGSRWRVRTGGRLSSR